MGSTWASGYVQCPFYKRDKEDKLYDRCGKEISRRKRILCESPVPGSSLSLTFVKKKDFDMQLKIFCCDKYKCCEIYRMLSQMYEEGP